MYFAFCFVFSALYSPLQCSAPSSAEAGQWFGLQASLAQAHYERPADKGTPAARQHAREDVF